MHIQLSDHFTYQKLLRFTFPSIMMMIFTSIYGVVDGFFVSNFVGKTPFAALCCGTFIEKDARKVSCAINKAGLKGTYDVRVIVDDKKFETGIKIEC